VFETARNSPTQAQIQAINAGLVGSIALLNEIRAPALVEPR
jgi:hypothetical protein